MNRKLFFYKIWWSCVKISPLQTLKIWDKNINFWLSYCDIARGCFFLGHPVDDSIQQSYFKSQFTSSRFSAWRGDVNHISRLRCLEVRTPLYCQQISEQIETKNYLFNYLLQIATSSRYKIYIRTANNHWNKKDRSDQNINV